MIHLDNCTASLLDMTCKSKRNKEEGRQCKHFQRRNQIFSKGFCNILFLFYYNNIQHTTTNKLQQLLVNMLMRLQATPWYQTTLAVSFLFFLHGLLQYPHYAWEHLGKQIPFAHFHSNYFISTLLITYSFKCIPSRYLWQPYC